LLILLRGIKRVVLLRYYAWTLRIQAVIRVISTVESGQRPLFRLPATPLDELLLLGLFFLLWIVRELFRLTAARRLRVYLEHAGIQFARLGVTFFLLDG